MRLFVLAAMLAIGTEAHAMKEKWFQTWNRPEYKEWAVPIPEGYLLHIIRKEKGELLVVQAKLIMGETGLPGFEVLEQQRVPDERAALMCFEMWERETVGCSEEV